LKLGCHGVIPAKLPLRLLRRAVPSILAGELWAPRQVLSEMLLDLLHAPTAKQGNLLTPREGHVLELVRLGYTNAEIAATLFISHETVRWHKRRLYRKIGSARMPANAEARRKLPISLQALQPSAAFSKHS
jgi:DNA-binding NarL/FixJ family response regulator